MGTRLAAPSLHTPHSDCRPAPASCGGLARSVISWGQGQTHIFLVYCLPLVGVQWHLMDSRYCTTIRLCTFWGLFLGGFFWCRELNPGVSPVSPSAGITGGGHRAGHDSLSSQTEAVPVGNGTQMLQNEDVSEVTVLRPRVPSSRWQPPLYFPFSLGWVTLASHLTEWALAVSVPHAWLTSLPRMSSWSVCVVACVRGPFHIRAEQQSLRTLRDAPFHPLVDTWTAAPFGY